MNFGAFGIPPASSAPRGTSQSPYAAKTGNYTIVAGDSNGVINWTTAGFTATLTAAAALWAGFRVTLMNTAASGDVTIDPNASETLDGLTTRLLRPGNGVTIVCDGTNWRTVSGQYSYDSGDQTITSAGLLTLAHGLGIKPTSVEICLRCATAENNFSVNDEITIGTSQNGTGFGVNRGIALEKDATNITIRFGSGATVFGYVDGTTGAECNLTNANWKLIIRARV